MNENFDNICNDGVLNETIHWIEESDSSVSDFDETEDFEDNSKIIKLTMNINSICGFEKLSKNDHCGTKRKKYDDSISINDKVDPYDIYKFWSNKQNCNSKYYELLSSPFQLCTVKHFITNNSILNFIRDEFGQLMWRKRQLDLYEFYQTDDLLNNKEKFLSKMYEFLKEHVMPWVSKATGLPLNKISASCSSYSFGDYLLVHDDLQNDRCVAFIFYLTGLDKDGFDLWKPHFGGALELFSKDENGQPSEATTKIYPSHNQFVFFQVKKDSYHQVAEILTMDYSRLSINGWFHSSEISLEEPPDLINIDFGLFGTNQIFPNTEMCLKSAINDIFLDESTINSIQTHIEENSEISLQKYFNEDYYQIIESELSNTDIVWEWIGPPNRRHYEIANETTLPNKLKSFLKLFQSISFFKLMKSYTDLDLVPDTDMNPSMRFELQRWSAGCYSLMSEKCWFTDSELDLIVYFHCSESLYSVGQIMYIAREENDQEALITLLPRNNTLNIIYRDEGTARIVPYIPHRSLNSQFYILVCSYKQ